jgi:hypothetical protein
MEKSDVFAWVFVSEEAVSTSVAVTGRSSMRFVEGASSLYTAKLALLCASVESSASISIPESYFPFPTKSSGRGFLEANSESLDEFEAGRRGALFRRKILLADVGLG